MIARSSTAGLSNRSHSVPSVSIETQRAVGRTLRVFEEEPQPLTVAACEELRDALRSGQLAGVEVPLGLVTQAIVLSRAHHDFAGDVLRRLATLPVTSSEDERAQLRAAFVVCSQEAFRQGEPVRWRSAELMLDQLRRAGAAPLEPGDHETLQVLVERAADATLLLNTTDQPRVTRLLTAIIRRLTIGTAPTLERDQLISLLQRCTDLPRVHYDLPGMRSLRDTCAQIAQHWLAAWGEADDGADGLRSFRLNLLTDDPDIQRRALLNMRDRAGDDDESASGRLALCATWALQRSSHAPVAELAASVFESISEPPLAAQYLWMATQLGDVERGRRWIERWQDAPGAPSKRLLEARFHLNQGAWAESVRLAARPLSVWSAFSREDVDAGAPDALVVHSLARTCQEARFLGQVREFSIACAVAPPTSDWTRTTVIVVPNQLMFATQLPVAAIERARQNGAEIVSLVAGMYPHSDDLSPAAAVLRDRIVAGLYVDRVRPCRHLSDDWEIDFEHERAIYRGQDWFPGLHNSLGIKFRRFTLDLEDPVIRIHAVRHLLMVETLHALFEEFWRTIDEERYYPFALVGVQASLGSVIRTIITHAGRPNVRAVHVSNGFEAFESRFAIDDLSGNAFARYHSVTDLTDRPNTPLGFRPAPQDVPTTLFRREQAYRRGNATLDAFVSKADRRAERARTAHRPRDPGPRRILMLGTILPDLSIPHDHGVAHRNIADWVAHTYETISGIDAQLVVKLHPAELDDRIAFYVTESFADLLPGRSGVIVLPYDTPFHEAVTDADLTVLWAGTSVLELCLMGAPHVVAGRFANEEYPVSRREHFSTREEYEDLLAGRRSVEVDRSARLRAIDVIHRITTSPLREYSDQPRRMLLNGQVWPPRIDVSTASVLMADPGIERLARRLSVPASDRAPTIARRLPSVWRRGRR